MPPKRKTKLNTSMIKKKKLESREVTDKDKDEKTSFAYDYSKAKQDFQYNEVNASSVQEELCEKRTTYEPCLATETEREMPLVFSKESNPGIAYLTPHPLTTDLYCYHCDGNIKGIPWMVPVDRKNGYFVMGDCLFCQAPCALRHIIDKGDFHASLQGALFADYAIRYRGIDVSKLNVAPPRKMLDRYSLTGISLEEFRGPMCSSDMTVAERLKPFIPATIVFEKKHSNQARWNVRGIRIPTQEEVDRIYKEERVVGTQPFPGQTPIYERYYKAYESKSGALRSEKTKGPISSIVKQKKRKVKKAVEPVVEKNEGVKT